MRIQKTKKLLAIVNVIEALLFRELKTRFGKNKLGYFWVVGEPMLHIAVLLLIFSSVKNQTISQLPFALFLISGLLPFFMFKSIVMKIIDGISANKPLFSYKPVKPIYVFISRTLLETGIYFVSLVLLMTLFGWITSFSIIPFKLLDSFLAFSLLVFFAFALGICLAILVYSAESARAVISTAFTVLYFASGIMYPLWIVPSEYVSLLMLNPLVHIFETFRGSYFATYSVASGVDMVYPTLFFVTFLYIGLWLYYHKRATLGASV